MARFFGLIEAEFFKSDASSRFDANQYQESMRYMFKTGLEDACRKALDEAAALADHPVSARLVARLRGRFDDWCAHKADFERPELIVPNTTDWAKAAVTDRFYLRGSVGRQPPQYSSLAVRHDTQTIFVRFRCEDTAVKNLDAPPYDPSRETDLEHDGVKIGLALGRGPDAPSVALSCDVNGNRSDIKSVKPWRAFNADGKATCVRDKRGYTVDFEIPFKSFGLDPERNKNLDVYFYRLIRHKEKSGRKKISTWGGSDPRKRPSWGVLKFE